jgi:hypothetical protein
VAEVPFAGAVHDPSWIDDRRVLFLAEYQGRFQVHIYDVESAQLQRVSDAPYLAFQPRAHGNAIRFLNRKGWRWTIDELPLPAAGNTESQQVAALPQEAPSTQATTANREIQIHSDQPYSQLDSLFYPHFRAPLLVSSEEGANLIGLQLAGGDPLGFHRWAIFGQYDLIGHYVSGGAHYINSMLAPLELRAELEYHKWNESILVGNETEAGPLHAETRGLFAVGRTIRSSRIDLVGIALKSQEADNPDPDLRERQLAGPGLQLQHQALRSTPYAGARQGYTASAAATHYNEALSSLDVDLTDLGASLNLITPLPFFARHTLALGLRGRRLYGLDRDKSFLVIGGSTAAAELWRKSDQEDPDEALLPSPEPLVTFQEPLRGFEDLEFSSDRIAIADLSYRLPLILDFGFASTAYLLPSLFFHQINLELFAAGASDSFAKFDAHKHLAAGAAAALDLSLWVIPMRLRYQLARRFTDDEALVHLLTLGAAL